MKFFYFIATILLFTACDQSSNVPSKTFWMDNPTENAISVKIDTENYNLPANSGLNVKLSAGPHVMFYNGDSLKFLVKPNDQNTVINPTLSNYIFHHSLFVVEGQEDRAEAEMEANEKAYYSPFVLETGDTILVPFKVIENHLFIDQYEYYWHFNITQPYEDISLNLGNSNIATINRSKLFREKDFLEYIGTEDLIEGFKLPQKRYTFKDQKAFVLIPDSLKMDCEVAQVYLDKYRAKYNDLLQADASNYQLALDSVRFGYYNIFPTAIEKECSPRYNKEKSGKDNFDKVNVIIGKNLEKFSMKNAIIVN